MWLEQWISDIILFSLLIRKDLSMKLPDVLDHFDVMK